MDTFLAKEVEEFRRVDVWAVIKREGDLVGKGAALNIDTVRD